VAAAGARVTAIEPLIDGFDLFAHVRAELAARVPDLPPLSPRTAAELDPDRDGHFDVIFSINVLEHCKPLAASLDGIGRVLGSGGRMMHTCANYRVPYEPHLRRPLLPLAPGLTARVSPSMARHPVWPTLNFITAGDLARFARRAGLVLELEPGVMTSAVARLDDDPAFARRQGWAGRLARAVARTGVLSLIPASWQTPMVAHLHRPPA
jgi:SAM-dependent methyltransferase